LRSWSQKNRASLSRAARTLRLPSTTAAGSLESMLAVQTKASASLPPCLADEVLLVHPRGELDDSGGTSRNAGRTGRAAAPAIRSGRRSRSPAPRPRPA
jgi:hypothetical protein